MLWRSSSEPWPGKAALPQGRAGGAALALPCRTADTADEALSQALGSSG